MDEIKGIARVKFHPGKVEEWKRLTEEHHQRQLFSPHCRVVSR